MRIAILGNSGSGKSTLALWLAARTRAPLLDLDTVAWEPGSIAVSRSANAAEDDVRSFCTTYNSWIIEGCYANLVNAALQFRPRLLFLNPGERQCLENCRAFLAWSHRRQKSWNGPPNSCTSSCQHELPHASSEYFLQSSSRVSPPRHGQLFCRSWLQLSCLRVRCRTSIRAAQARRRLFPLTPKCGPSHFFPGVLLPSRSTVWTGKRWVLEPRKFLLILAPTRSRLPATR